MSLSESALRLRERRYSPIDMFSFFQHTLGVHDKETIAILSFEVSEVSEEIWGPGIENDEAI